MSAFQQIINLRNKKFVKRGLPFIILIVGGSFALKEFAQIRYTFSKKKQISQEEFEKMGVKKKPAEEVTLETEYEKIKKLDIDHWENKRGPRPWEDVEVK